MQILFGNPDGKKHSVKFTEIDAAGAPVEKGHVYYMQRAKMTPANGFPRSEDTKVLVMEVTGQP